MNNNYSISIVDGREVPPPVVRQDYTLSGTHAGGVHVEAGEGAVVTVTGAIQGSATVWPATGPHSMIGRHAAPQGASPGSRPRTKGERRERETRTNGGSYSGSTASFR